MGNRGLYKNECFHMLGSSESERLKVTALNLFRPTASSPFITTKPPGAEREGEGEKR
jgi:hypothetical protein